MLKNDILIAKEITTMFINGCNAKALICISISCDLLAFEKNELISECKAETRKSLLLFFTSPLSLLRCCEVSQHMQRFPLLLFDACFYIALKTLPLPYFTWIQYNITSLKTLTTDTNLCVWGRGQKRQKQEMHAKIELLNKKMRRAVNVIKYCILIFYQKSMSNNLRGELARAQATKMSIAY